MSREPRNFVNDGIYHITQRGIEDKKIFLDKSDYFRGIFSLYEFNNSNPVEIAERRAERTRFKKIYWGHSYPNFGEDSPPPVEPDRRKRWVDILAFCLMPNHFHLLLKQLKENGISEFMRKIGGYVKYFNQKYQRKGHLFQQRFWSTEIKDDKQLKTAFVYDWTNPLSLIEPGWKEKGIKDTTKAIKFLEKYRWSSYLDCIGIKNFPSLIEAEKDFIMEVMGGAEGCKQAVNDWILHKGEITRTAQSFPKLFLE